MERHSDSLDRPNNFDILTQPYAGVVPTERVVIDRFRGSDRTQFWYITDEGGLIEIMNHKVLTGSSTDGQFTPGVYSFDDGKKTAFFI